MKRVPNSILWLLEPTINRKSLKDKNETRTFSTQGETVRENLFQIAIAQGVSLKRIVFAPRISKSLHIERHFAADLFLDTFQYSAHSTATDSLRGVRMSLNFS